MKKSNERVGGEKEAKERGMKEEKGPKKRRVEEGRRKGTEGLTKGTEGYKESKKKGPK